VLKKILFIIIGFIVVLTIFFNVLPKPTLTKYKVAVSVEGIKNNAKTVMVEAFQDETHISSNLKIYSDTATGNLVLAKGKWLINVHVYDRNKTSLQDTSYIVSVITDNQLLRLYLYGFGRDEFLRINNTDIVNDKNSKIILRGFGLTNGVYNLTNPLELFNQTYNLGLADYQNMHNAGANMVRFYIQYDWLNSSNEENFFKYLDTQIKSARLQGIYLILNLHFFGMSNDIKAGKAEGFYKGDLIKAGYNIVEFWDKISRRYNYEPTIAGYDIVNEPECSARFSEAKLYDIYNGVIHVLRKNNDDHIVIIADPVNKALHNKESYFLNEEPFKKLADDNVLYEYHFYQPIEFTHQGFFDSDYFELGASYPFSRYNATYKGGFYDNPYIKNTKRNDWEYVKGYWVDFTEQLKCSVNVGEDMFNLNLSAGKLKGKVWFDDIVLERRNKETRKISRLNVPNANFKLAKSFSGWVQTPQPSDKPAGWYFLADEGSKGIVAYWDKGNSHLGDDSGSLFIDGTNATWSHQNPWARWAQDGGAMSVFYPIDSEYEYRVSSWVKADSNEAYNVSLSFAINKVKVVRVDRNYLHNFINEYYDKWAQHNNVPVFCGEFGVTNPSNLSANNAMNSTSQKKWLNDLLDIFESGATKHWAYHSYKSYANRADLFGLYDDKLQDTVLQKVLSHRLLK